MFRRLAISDLLLFIPKRFDDERGYFVETYNRRLLEPEIGDIDWLQDNQSVSRPRGVVRGLHFQTPPFAQDKLVRCQRGSVLDVAVDIRGGSPTFGQHASVVLTASGGEQIFIPKGFAHGFATLEENCELAYKVTNYYSAEHDRAIRWNDPALKIDWSIAPSDAVLSPKDSAAPLLAETPVFFRFGE